MLAMKRKRVILSSVFIAASIGLAPVGWTQASAATPSETHVSTSAGVKVPRSDHDYRRGFKDGFRSGLHQGQHNCRHDNRHHNGHNGRHDDANGNGHAGGKQAAAIHHKGAQQDYRRGFKDGFRSGLHQGQRSCHH
jgi:flagellar biosynthesis/type III secretory pathway protein FliH